MFGADWWHHDLAQSAMGQPDVIRRSILFAVGVIATHAAAWDTLFVAVQGAIGLGLVVGRFERLAVAASIPFAFGVWWVGEGLGMLPTGFALLPSGAPGPVVLYALLGLLAWPHLTADAAAAVRARAGRIVWVVLWAGQAALLVPWRFPSGQVLSAAASEGGSDGPRLLGALSRHVQSLAFGHGVLMAFALAACELAVGLGVLSPRYARPALCVGVGLSAAVLGGVPGCRGDRRRWGDRRRCGAALRAAGTLPHAGPTHSTRAHDLPSLVIVRQASIA